MNSQRVRINITISPEAHEALVEMAGGERKMGSWLDATILDIYHNRMPDAAVINLEQARVLLDKILGNKKAAG